jgi:hypothetical protein
VSFADITLCVASQRVKPKVNVSTQCGNFWIHPHTTFRLVRYIVLNVHAPRIKVVIQRTDFARHTSVYWINFRGITSKLCYEISMKC